MNRTAIVTPGIIRAALPIPKDLKMPYKFECLIIGAFHKPSIIARRGTLYHFYCAVSHKYGQGISVATRRPGPKTA